MRGAITCLVLVLMYAHSHAQPVHMGSVEIVEKGIFIIEGKTKVEDRALSAGFRYLASSIKKVEETTIVPGKLGIHFGFRYKIIGEPVGASALLRFILRYPQPGIRNPSTHQISTSGEFTETRTIGDIHYRGFGFDSPSEVVLGRWTFEIWYEDQKLTEQAFTVVKAR
jgi:Domain of unknown function (DUF3859)